ncbi:MAG: hypothetical protein LBG31_02920 [Prevotellaceae bacterium]|jgi:hypothetical protein|nr:hypothetical protein [Prevotellaceae bacterium]
MNTEMALRKKGMKTLISNLGKVEAEKFISLIIREPFDYTEWQQNLFSDFSVKELSNLAMKEYKTGAPETSPSTKD